MRMPDVRFLDYVFTRGRFDGNQLAVIPDVRAN
jgi:predicted PhzF superfamily epimerase YddE/YHI9